MKKFRILPDATSDPEQKAANSVVKLMAGAAALTVGTLCVSGYLMQKKFFPTEK